MAVRRRRPLVPPPYPRRNRYTPLSSEQSPLVSVSAVSLRLIAKTALALFSRRLSFVDLRWEHAGSKAISGLGLPWVSGRISMEIVTHPGVGMCYNSMTFQVLVNFTISFTGVTLASSR